MNRQQTQRGKSERGVVGSVDGPWRETDIVLAITELEASTAAVTQQEQAIRAQEKVLKEHFDRTRPEAETKSNFEVHVTQRQAGEAQHIRFAVSSVATGTSCADVWEER